MSYCFIFLPPKPLHQLASWDSQNVGTTSRMAFKLEPRSMIALDSSPLYQIATLLLGATVSTFTTFFEGELPSHHISRLQTHASSESFVLLNQ